MCALTTLRRAVTVACLPLFVGACGDGARDGGQPDPDVADSAPPAAPTDDAATLDPISMAYEALVRADFAALPGIIEALDEQVASHPDDGRSAFYAGVMRLWRIAERERDPEYGVPEMAADSLGPGGAIEQLDRARTLLPEDARAAAFFGIAQVAVGAFTADEDRIDLGRQALADAVPLYPAYVHGVEALAFGPLARDHRYFAEAEPALQSSAEACGYTAGADGQAFEYPTGPMPSLLGACNDEGTVAHVWEGFFLTYGDVAVKLGDAERGRALYESAKASPSYDRWLLQDVLDRRIEDADARAQLYLDDDPANDPRTWMDEGRLCTGCHANAP